MAGTIFINYRREDSISIAGRLHDRLAQAFGRKNLFMDVDHIPAGVDFVAHLNSQVAACDVILVVIGPNWLAAKDESGRRRLDNPEDFVTIEIATALARDIRVIPVLVDGAHMPKADELPNSLKPLARRQALEVRQLHFGRDAEALLERVREALGDEPARPAWWRGRAAVGAAAVVVLLLIGVGGYAFLRHFVEQGVQRAELKWEEERRAAEAQANRKVAQAEQQPSTAPKAVEQESQARAAAEAEAKRKADDAERQRVAAAKAEEERKAQQAAAEEAERQRLAAVKAEEDRKRTEADARARYSALVSQGNMDTNAGDFERAISTFSVAIGLNPQYALAFYGRGVAYGKKGKNDQAIADYNQAIRLDPRYALAFVSRGLAYERKGDNDRAIADYNQAIRLDPKYAISFNSRGVAYGNKGRYDQAIADFSEAVRLDPTYALAFSNRGLAYEKKGDNERAIADYNEAIRLSPDEATLFCRRGRAKLKIKEQSGNADIAKARRLDASVSCQ